MLLCMLQGGSGMQVLAKSCKMIPVMVMGTIIGGKFYSSLEYGCALLIAAGISLFAKQSSAKVVSKLAAPNAPLGYALCFLNLMFDGYTNAMQVEIICTASTTLVTPPLHVDSFTCTCSRSGHVSGSQ